MVYWMLTKLAPSRFAGFARGIIAQERVVQLSIRNEREELDAQFARQLRWLLVEITMEITI